MESKILLFPGPFLYTYKLKNHSRIKKKLVDFIENDVVSTNKKCGEGTVVKTSYYDVMESGENDSFFKYLSNLDLLKDIVWNPMDDCISQLPFLVQSYPKKSSVDSIWYNYFENGGFHEPHIHQNSFISGIYILHLEEKNPTVFFGSGSSNDSFNYFYHETDYLEEGTIVLFPSDMWHFVNSVKKKRITISFNISSTFA